MSRKYNYFAGPSVLPMDVLNTLEKENEVEFLITAQLVEEEVD